MNISVIICTWNNCHRLEKTLKAISLCTIPKETSWELVIINNNCTDNTDATVNKYLERLPIKYEKEPVQGLSRSKNTGLELASGELIIFTDDDVSPCKEWILTYWKAYQKFGSNHFFGGPITSDFEDQSFDKGLLKVAPPSIKGLNLGEIDFQIDSRTYFVSANWACAHSNLQKVGTFDENIGLNPLNNQIKTGEENDIMDKLRKLRVEGRYLHNAHIEHFVPATKTTPEHIISRLDAAADYFANKKKSQRNVILKIMGIPMCNILKVPVFYLLFVIKKNFKKPHTDTYLQFYKAKSQVIAFFKLTLKKTTH